MKRVSIMPLAVRPLVGVIACNKETDGQSSASVLRRYITPLADYAGASAIIVPSLPKLADIRRVARMIDGLMLTGSASNVASHHYGMADPAAEGPFDHDRDEVMIELVSEMAGLEKPIFGICRGLQEINVALGGTLRRDLATCDRPIAHHAPDDATYDEMFAWSHDIDIAPGGLLARIYGEPRIRVNSVHFQGIDRLAPDLIVEATAPDGIVESVSARLGAAARLLAVQWHPEWQTERDEAAQQLFGAFGTMLRGDHLIAAPR